MRVHGRSWQAVGWDVTNRAVYWIDQRLLPHTFEVLRTRNPERIARAIETMAIRGAPSIGAAAAFGLALAWKADPPRFFEHWLPRFRKTRPTAVNLFHACDWMESLAKESEDFDSLIDAAQQYAEREVAANRKIGARMAELLARGERRILTHCNAGWLAAVDWGTATAGIYELQRAGEAPFVWVDETRPRLQGARLTAWELQQEGVACALQADAAAAWMMASGKVDAVVVGADRIARNGDVANKIGTYALSLAARAHGVPFYVAAPSSTFDARAESGADIPIEHRNADELSRIDGVDDSGDIQHIRIAADVPANNPAFDVTPFDHVTAIISEQGEYIPPSQEEH
ncbi:MAG: S-methyl-5-thioribose-1-phosphate isomerase [Zetaproteobacteria bacterium]|nr:MAG: S-methyl-5-thioribose-1-phosphate isomerase [Zetaproteobacteria bacterium]